MKRFVCLVLLVLVSCATSPPPRSEAAIKADVLQLVKEMEAWWETHTGDTGTPVSFSAVLKANPDLRKRWNALEREYQRLRK
jgi:hypothetical protein